jgi:hypothetical protein
MGSRDTRHEFEQIVDRLTSDYPSLKGTSRRPWPRSILIAVLVVGAVGWGLLSVAMVAWGRSGVILTLAVVAVVAIAGAIDARRRRLR